MYPGHMSVSDALDPVIAEAVIQKGGALQGFANPQLGGGIELFKPVTGTHGTC